MLANNTTSPSELMIARLFQIGIALIPALTGFLAAINGIIGSEFTLQNIIKPLLSMEGARPEFVHSARAITNDLHAIFYYLLIGIEGLIGVLAMIGIIKMLKNFCGIDAQFLQAQTWARSACLLGTLVWGLGFFVLAGDFFLAWQNPNIAYLQVSGLNYAFIMIIPYFIMKAYQCSHSL